MKLIPSNRQIKNYYLRTTILVGLTILLLLIIPLTKHGYLGAQGEILEGTPTTEQNSSRIVGGNEADPGEWPWQVAIVWRGGDPFYDQFCAGSLIDPSWVITAAHCVYDDWYGDYTSDIQVIAGIHNLGYPDPGHLRRNLSEIIVHPNYDANKVDYDIALLKLSSPVPFRQSGAQGLAIGGIAPVFSNIGPLTGEVSTAIGWGNRGYPIYDYPYSLQEVEIPIISNSACNAIYGGRISNRMMCTNHSGGGKGTCYADSGGPLMIFNSNNNRWELAGVTSWGYDCYEADFPSVFVRVSEVSNWIYSNIGSGFSISGKVTNSQGVGITGVILSNGIGQSVHTDSQGNYFFSNLPAASYSITPSKQGTTFSPPSRTVSVPPSSINEDFTAGSLQWPLSNIGTGALGNSLESGSQIVISGTGQDIWGSSDSFVFAHKKGNGDFELIARIHTWNAAGTNTAKAGLMMRSSANPDAPHFTIHLTGPQNALKLKWRNVSGATTGTFSGPNNITLPIWLKLTKFGTTLTAFYSHNGVLWTQLGQPQTINGLSADFEYGMAVTSNALDRSAVATFSEPQVIPWTATNIGTDANGQTTVAGGLVLMTATGGEIFGTADSIHYYQMPGSGDMDLRARFMTWEPMGIASAKAGLMIRASTAPNAPHLTLHLTGTDRGIKVKYRTTAGGSTTNINGPNSFNLPVWLRINKTGNVFRAYYSNNGTSWTAIGSGITLNNMPQNYLYGMALTSSSVGTFVNSSLTDVRIGSLPSAPPPTPTITPSPIATIKPSPTVNPTFEPPVTPTPTPTGTVGSPDPTATLTPEGTIAPTATISETPDLNFIIYLPMQIGDPSPIAEMNSPLKPLMLQIRSMLNSINFYINPTFFFAKG
jgi:secreted trypsin-like serine protease